MATKDLFHSIKGTLSHPAGAAETAATENKATATGGADTTGFESVTVMAIAHTLTAGTLAVAAQDSDDGTTWGALTDLTTCIANSQLIGGVGDAAGQNRSATINAAGVVMLGVKDCKKYVRAVMVKAGYAGIMSGHVILGSPRHHGQAQGGTQSVV